MKSTWDHVWPKAESVAEGALLGHYCGHEAHNALPAPRVSSSRSEHPIHTKPHYFKPFFPHGPLSGGDFSPRIAFTSSAKLNHNYMVPPCMDHGEIKDLPISADPEVAPKTWLFPQQTRRKVVLHFL